MEMFELDQLIGQLEFKPNPEKSLFIVQRRQKKLLKKYSKTWRKNEKEKLRERIERSAYNERLDERESLVALLFRSSSLIKHQSRGFQGERKKNRRMNNLPCQRQRVFENSFSGIDAAKAAKVNVYFMKQMRIVSIFRRAFIILVDSPDIGESRGNNNGE